MSVDKKKIGYEAAAETEQDEQDEEEGALP